MRILIHNGYNATPHLETEMEIAVDLMNAGHEVYFTHCKGELETCYGNPDHKSWICKNCSAKKKKAFDVLGLSRNQIVPIPHVDITDIPIPQKFLTLEELKDYTYDGVDIGMGVASSLISRIRDHRPALDAYQDLIFTGLRTALYAYRSAEVIFDQVKPDEVVLFNGRFLEIRPVMRLCEKRGIKYYTHERGGVASTYLYRGNDIPHSLVAAETEIHSLWEQGGAEKETIGEQFFVDRRNRVVQSWYVFTEGQEKGRLPEGFNTDKKKIVLFNSSMDEYEGIAGFTSKIYKDDNNGIRRILEHFQHNDQYHFYLRVHPNLSNLDNTQMRELQEIGNLFKNITIIGPTEQVDTYALVDAADIVAVFGSTVGAEAAYWKKPVILLGNAFYSSINGFYQPETHEEVIRYMEQDLPPAKSDNDILKYGYWELNKGLPYKHYKPASLTTGTFNGEVINISKFRKLLFYCWGKLTS